MNVYNYNIIENSFIEISMHKAESSRHFSEVALAPSLRERRSDIEGK